MKYPKLLALFLMLPSLSFGQFLVEQYDSFKKANVLIVNANYPFEDMFNGTLEYLIDKGYEVADYDERLGVIKTSPRKVKGLGNTVCSLKLFVFDGKIIVRGSFNNNVNIDADLLEVQSSDERVSNRGMKGSSYKSSFELMESIGHQLTDWFEGEMLYAYEEI